MTDNAIILIALFLAGIIRFTLVGGWGEYGGHHALPRLVGFGMQAGFVLGYIGQRRGWWSSNKNQTGT